MLGEIRRILAPHGIDRVGVCRYRDCLPLLPCRAMKRIPEHARSVIVLLLPYHTGEYPDRNLARYAVAQDYHRVAGEILDDLCYKLQIRYPGEAFVPFVDNSPIREVSAAQLAGLGAAGRNGQLIDSIYGSMVFVGTVVTTAECDIDNPIQEYCPGCGKCVAACPTGALRGDGTVEKERCRSHITQKKGELSRWEEEQIRLGGMVWGCDICLDACPLNKDRPITPIRAFLENPQPVLTVENLHELMEQKPYGYRGEKVLLRNVALIHENNGS